MLSFQGQRGYGCFILYGVNIVMGFNISESTAENIRAVYGREAFAVQRDRALSLLRLLCEKYTHSEKEAVFISVPGRCELIGNHTDHQGGRVITAAVSSDAMAACAIRGDGVIHVSSEGYDDMIIDATDTVMRPAEKNTSAALLRGVCAACREQGIAFGGFDAVIASDVLAGSGLSSSAVFEVLIGAVIDNLYNNGTVGPLRTAMIAQRAENVYFGKPSGLEDQLACAEGGLSFMDFASPAAPVCEKPDAAVFCRDYLICITATGGSHAALAEEYAAIPREMTAVAEALGVQRLSQADESAFYRQTAALRERLPDRALLRAHHFFGENRRVAAALDAIKTGDSSLLLDLVIASGRSSCQYLQNVCVPGETANQSLLLALALSEKLLAGRGAWRLQGGGFAGTAIAAVRREDAGMFAGAMREVFGAEAVTVTAVRSAGAVKL